MRLLVILAAASLLASPAHADPVGGEFVPGRVVVKWRSPSVMRTVANATLHRAVAADRQILQTAPTREATLALVATLSANPDVAYAEPDYIRHRTGDPITPSDPLFARQWALPMINAPQAWSRSTGSSAVTVAIIDTGAVMHPELAERIAGGYDFITDPTNAADGGGRDEDWTDTGDSTDQSSALHGTHVAGIIAAQSNNGVGVAGLDWGCRLVIVRALGVRHGTGVDSDISDAIRWAAGLHVDGVPDNPHPAAVINMSFGGAGFSQSMQDAIHEAVGAGTIVVAAAGNLAVDAKGDSPAGLDGVISVGAVDPTGVMASYSNYGSVVSLMAPGGSPLRDPMTGQPEGVLSTIQLVGSGFTYTYYAGTSQAAPFVSGTVSLMKGLFPGMNASDARRLLSATANPSAKCANPSDPTLAGCGAGLLDVDAALAAAADAGLAGGGGHLNNEVHGGFGCAIAPAAADAPAATGGWLLFLAGLAVAALRRRVL
ncbi:MAG: peptidase and in kexin sedolisin [Myxococcales bacterium]|nr:peptidase and in kexin sedolisin [Myxococcales bacterium]